MIEESAIHNSPNTTAINARRLTELEFRRGTLHHQCNRFRKTTRINANIETLYPGLFRNILVDNERKLLVCDVPKVASTTIKKWLLDSTERYNEISSNISVHNRRHLSSFNLVYLSDYNMSEIVHKVVSYNKMIIVRNPFERVVSAYRDKFRKQNKWNTHFHRKYGRVMIQRYRLNASVTSRRKGHDVTFTEFLKFLVDSRPGGDTNPHWDSYMSLCLPCLLRYQYIGKLETLNSDLEFVTGILRSKHTRHIVAIRKPSSADVMNQYYSRIEIKVLKKLLQVYLMDMKMFGYPLPS